MIFGTVAVLISIFIAMQYIYYEGHKLVREDVDIAANQAAFKKEFQDFCLKGRNLIGEISLPFFVFLAGFVCHHLSYRKIRDLSEKKIIEQYSKIKKL